MDPVSSVVLYAILWWMTFFVVLPLNLKTQGDVGEVVPGTPPGAPHKVNIRRKMLVTSVAALVVWGIVQAVLMSGFVSIRMFDVNETLPPINTTE